MVFSLTVSLAGGSRAIVALPHVLPDPALIYAEQGEDNEGGRPAGHGDPLGLRSALPGPARTALDTLTERIRTMAAALSSDVANGRVGTRHNTFGHRSRVLRQLAARRDRLRLDQLRIAEQQR